MDPAKETMARTSTGKNANRAKRAKSRHLALSKGRRAGREVLAHGHVTTENRNGLAVVGRGTYATGTVERRASEVMFEAKAKEGGRRITVGMDRVYDVGDDVVKQHALNVVPHLSQYSSGNPNEGQSAIDGPTTRPDAAACLKHAGAMANAS